MISRQIWCAKFLKVLPNHPPSRSTSFVQVKLLCIMEVSIQHSWRTPLFKTNSMMFWTILRLLTSTRLEENCGQVLTLLPKGLHSSQGQVTRTKWSMPKQWQQWRICHGMNGSNCTPNVTIVVRRVIVISILIALNTFNKSNQVRSYVDQSTNVLVLVDRHCLVTLVADCLVPLVVLNLDVISWRNQRQRRSFRLSKALFTNDKNDKEEEDKSNEKQDGDADNDQGVDDDVRAFLSLAGSLND
jgi:hypothetical protein